jgi:hypothetical protein
VTKSHLINVVATPLWGVCIFEAARSGRRTAPWLQRVRIYEMAFSHFVDMRITQGVKE